MALQKDIVREKMTDDNKKTPTDDKMQNCQPGKKETKNI